MCKALPFRPLALALTAALTLAATAAAAQEAAATECFPKCRTGYLCHQGVCISGCNPPCADDERCTADGECVLKAPAPPPAVAAPPPAEPPKPPYVPRGIVAGLGAGALLCAADGICEDRAHDVGVAGALRGGYRPLPWLVVDAEITLVPIVVKNTAQIDRAYLFAAGLGARFLPLARRHAVDPVLGLRVGYFLEWSAPGDADESSVAKTWYHGVHLAYSAGVAFNVAPVFSLGLAIDVFEPFRVSSCVAVEAQAGAPGTPSQPASTQCVEPAVTSFPFYVALGVNGTFFL